MPSTTKPALKGNQWLLERVNSAFFEPRSFVELGWLRVLVYATALLLSFTLLGHYALWADVDEVFWQPVFVFQLFSLSPHSPSALLFLLWSFRALLLLAMLGTGGRPIRFAAAVLSLYVFGLPHNFGKVDHGDAVVIFCLVILAFSDADRGFSIRSVWLRTRGLPSTPLRLSPEARWPVASMQLMLTVALAEAGFAKLRTSGFAWITTDNLRFVIERHAFTHQPLLNLSQLFEYVPWLPNAFAGGTVAFEILAPLLIIARGPMKVILLVGVLGMLAGFSAALGIVALQFDLLVLVLFVPWRSVLAKSLRARRWLPRYTILYDGSCGICAKTMRLVGGIDVFKRLEIVDLVNQWDEVTRRFPFVSLDRALVDLHAIRQGESRATAGFDAYQSFARSVPLFWPIWFASYAPVISHVGKRIYRYVADHRHEDGCEIPPIVRS